MALNCTFIVLALVLFINIINFRKIHSFSLGKDDLQNEKYNLENNLKISNEENLMESIFLKKQFNFENLNNNADNDDDDDDDDEDDSSEDDNDDGDNDKPVHPDETYDIHKREKDVRARLYTKDGPKKGIRLKLLEINSTILTPNVPTKVVIHGWWEYGGKGWMKTFKNEYFKKGDYNVITIGWRKWADDIRYCLSAHRTTFVGNYVGDIIVELLKHKKLTLDKVHIIGFSLGAHASGVAGKRIQYKTNGTIDRITGLDPAGPSFEHSFLGCKYGDDRSLRKTDAKFLDVIHASRLLGTSKSLGHVDFWPNDGHEQPECFYVTVCCHLRAYQLFEKTINNPEYIGTECDSYKHFKRHKCKNNNKSPMGEYVFRAATNDYYLKTCGLLGQSPC